MKLSIILRTSDFRGDHETDVAVAIEPQPGETVEQLVRRVYQSVILPDHRDQLDLVIAKAAMRGDAVEIRVALEAPSGLVEPPPGFTP